MKKFLKLNTLLSLANILETLLKNFLLCDLMTAFARFQKYFLSLVRYSTHLCQWRIQSGHRASGTWSKSINLNENG